LVRRILRGTEAKGRIGAIFAPRTTVVVEEAEAGSHCPRCGATLARVCPHQPCSTPVLKVDDAYCRGCGRRYPWSLHRLRRDVAADAWIGPNTPHWTFGDGRVVVLWEGDLRETGVEAIAVPIDPGGLITPDIVAQLHTEAGEEIDDRSLADAPYDLGTSWVADAGPHSPVPLLIHAVAVERDRKTTQDLVREATTSVLEQAAHLRLRTVGLSHFAMSSDGVTTAQSATAMGKAFTDFLMTHGGCSIHEVVFALPHEMSREFAEGLRAVLPHEADTG
jgi:O-acetyl-ADP-ribose deacetylase (regulator of RNase III)